MDQAVNRGCRRRGSLLFHYTGISRICKSSLPKIWRLKQSQTLVSFPLLLGFWELATHLSHTNKLCFIIEGNKLRRKKD